MSERLPEVIQGMNLYVDGDEYMAKATKVEPNLPKPVVKEINSPGMAGAIEVYTRKWSKSEPKITVQGYRSELIGLVGNPESVDKPISLIAAMGADNIQTIEIELSGLWKDTEAGEWTTDAEATNSFTVTARQYKIKIDGKEVFYIDYELNKVRINGKEVTSDLNKALRARA